MTQTKRIICSGAIAGLLPGLSGCASTSERSSTPALNLEETVRSHEPASGATSCRKQLPELNKACGLNDYLAYATLNNPQLEAAYNRLKTALEVVSQARKEFYPDVTLGVDYVQTGEARMAGVSDSGKDSVMVGFSVNIPLWWSEFVFVDTKGVDLGTYVNRARKLIADNVKLPTGYFLSWGGQLEKNQSPGVFNGTIWPTGQGEWHASIGYENRQGKDATSFTTSVGS